MTDIELKRAFINRFCLKYGDKVEGSLAAVDHFFGKLVDEVKEQFHVLFLNGCNQVIESRLMFKGTLTSAAVYPREVIEAAIELHAAAVIIAHNHPSGNLALSRDDVAITNRLKKALSTIDISLYDHIIIGHGQEKYLSFADEEMI